MYESGPFGAADGAPVPVAVETFHAIKQRAGGTNGATQGSGRSRVNLLNWDGGEVPAGIFPEKQQKPEGQQER
jgi:nitrate reductase / nitrite oxidoreductase, beta subunit